MQRGPGGLFAGITYPLQALLLLYKTPRLRRFILFPIALNLLVGVTLYGGLLVVGFQAIEGVIAALPAWANLLEWLLRLLLVIALLLSTGFVLLQFGVLLGSPWYGKLSEELEHLRTGQHAVVPPSGLGSVAQDVWRAILFELKKLLLVMSCGLPLLLFNLLPGIGTAIASVGSIALAVTIICLDFLDPALERRRYSFRQKLGVVSRSLPASASFGLTCLGLVGIPGINLLAIPLCITAGTLFFCDRVLPTLPSSPSPHAVVPPAPPAHSP